METFKIRLNDFLYNSGVLGFYRVLEESEKEDLVQIEGNSLTIESKVLEEFEENYIQTMLDTFGEDTKWYTIINSKEMIKQIDIENEKEKLKNTLSTIKKVIESASYKSGYESIKEQAKENPYEILKLAKEEKDGQKQKEYMIRIIEHLQQYKEVYCMKDIIYTKINCFWEGLAFLNRNANKNNIQEEYRKVFVEPAKNYLIQTRNSDYTCIECGSKISKTEANGMSWLKDVGVDMNRKKSGFWDFKENTFLCPICSLIYSCIPLGFQMIGSNGIFINNNDSFIALQKDNLLFDKSEKVNFEGTYHKIIYNYINRITQIGNEKKTSYEPKNIQVIKRIGNKDNQYYEFNILSKDKLEILRKASKDFNYLINTKIYQEVLNNLLNGTGQYYLIDKLLRQKSEMKYVGNILNIQSISIEGGKNLEERKELIKEMIEAGERLQKYFFINKENKNKLEAYTLRLQDALRANNVEKFLKIFTMFYGSLGQPMPGGNSIKKMGENPEYFRLLGFYYIYGLGKIVDSKGGNENEK